MVRNRPIQRGFVFSKGPSWFLQWREDERDENDKLRRVKKTQRLCAVQKKDGTAITKREAERIAYETKLGEINHLSVLPKTLITVEEFWLWHFQPDHINRLKEAGKQHYAFFKPRILGAFGDLSLREFSSDIIQAYINELEPKFSSQTVKHYRNVISGLFRLAIAQGFHPGPNPVAAVRVPRMVRRPRRILTLENAHALIDALPSPCKEAAYLSVLTSMNVAEMFGLDRRHVNLRNEPVLTDEGLIPAGSIIIRQNWFRGHLDTLKTQARRRTVPLTPHLVEMLKALAAKAKLQDPEAPFFQTPKGTRLDANNCAGRVLRPTAKLVLKRNVGWHEFRHAAATFSELVSMPLAERVALLGHSQAEMTIYYTDPDVERRRPYLIEMERRIEAAAEKESDGVRLQTRVQGGSEAADRVLPPMRTTEEHDHQPADGLHQQALLPDAVDPTNLPVGG